MQVGLRDFEIISKNGVELDLERVDSGALSLSLLNLRQKLFAVTAQLPEVVEFLIYAALNRATVDERNRRLGNNCPVDSLPQIAQFIERAVQSLQSLGREPCQRNSQARNLSQRCSQSQHVARIRRLQRYAAQQALQIEDSVQSLPQFLSRHGLLHLRLDRVQSRIDLRNFD